MSKIYFYPDISYQDIKHIEKAHSVLNDKLLINRAVNVIYEKIINLINKTDSILFVCGPGNNGLDALITANKLASDNYKVEVFITDKLKTAIDINDYKFLKNHIEKSQLPFNIKKYFSFNDLNKILKFMLSDKKNNSDKINLVLLKKIGKPIINQRYTKNNLKSFLKKELMN